MNSPNSQCRSDIDLLQADECISRKVRLVLDETIVGQVVAVRVNLSNRVYEIEWCREGDVLTRQFYGFQLVLMEE